MIARPINIWMPRFGSESEGGILRLKDQSDWKIIHNLSDAEMRGKIEPLGVEIAENYVTNFMYLANEIVCDEKAFSIVMPQITSEVDVVQLSSPNGKFFLLYVTNIVDCLDADNSVFIRSPMSGSVVDIEKYVFLDDKIDASILFRIPNLKTRVFCTDIFKSVVEKYGLSGISFKVPFSPLRRIPSVF